METNSNKDLTLERQVLSDVCKIDVLKDFTKFIGKLPDFVFNEVTGLSSLQLYCKRDPGADVFL